MRTTILLWTKVLLTISCLFAFGCSSSPVRLVQVAPDIDLSANDWKIILEPTSDPHENRGSLVNFAFDLKNISGQQLKLRRMQFSYFDHESQMVKEQVVSQDQIADLLLVKGQPTDGAFSFEGKASLIRSSWQEFLEGWQVIEGQGYRMIDYETYEEGGARVHVGIFGPGDYAPAALFRNNWDQFLQDWQDLENSGHRMIDYETYEEGGVRIHVGIFGPGDYAPAALFRNNWDQFLQGWQDLENSGHRMIDYETYEEGGVRVHVGIFAPGNYTPAALFRNDWNQFLQDWQDLENSGHRMIDYETYENDGTRMHIGIFAPGNYSPRALFQNSWEAFLEGWQAIEDQGYRMIDYEYYEEEGNPVYAGVFTPGATIKWEDDTRLLFFSPQADFSKRNVASVEVTLFFDDGVPSWSFTVPIQNFSDSDLKISYSFPGKQSDLSLNQFWAMGQTGGHEGPKTELGVDERRRSDAHRGATWGGGTEGSYWFGQQYSFDLGVANWNGENWRFSQNSSDSNSDFYVWNKPVYAIEEGEVLFCWKDFQDNPNPPATLPRPAGVPAGGNILWIEHPGGEVALYAHFRQNTISDDVCPTNGLQTPAIPVSRGQFLGRVGNSGSSSGPHLHLHVQDGWTDSPLDQGQGLPLLFDGIKVRKAGSEFLQPWKDVDEESFVSGNAGTTLVKIDQNYRMIDFEPYLDEENINYVGIFAPGNYAPAALFRNSWDQFLQDWQGLENSGHRMIDYETYEEGGARVHVGIFGPGDYAPAALFRNNWDQFLQDWQDLENSGHRMIDYETYEEGGTRVHVGIFGPGDYAPAALFRNSWDQFLQDWQDLENSGHRMIDYETYEEGGARVHVGIFGPGDYVPAALFRNNWDQFLQDWQGLENSGHRMIDYETYENDGTRMHIGIFAPGNYSPRALFQNTWNEFLLGWQSME